MTARAVLIGLLLMPVVVYWIIEMEVVRYTHPTLVHPLSNVVFVLFWMVVLNRVVTAARPSARLLRSELLTVYLMLGVLSSLCTHDMLEILVTLLAYPFRFATAENQWRELIFPHLPDWLVVSDPAVGKGLYEGESSLFVKEHLLAWVGPYAWWTTFVFCLFFVLLCVNTFIRKQWIEHERLSYPIIQLPLEMTREGSGFFRSPVMWAGFGLAGAISLINLLNSVYPEVPLVPVKRRGIHAAMGWTNIGGVTIAFYPFAIGISFLMPLELLFSCWAFYWIYKLEIWMGHGFGFNQLSGYPFGNEQGFGAYMAILAFVLWTARGHLRRVVAAVVRGPTPDEAEEAMPYRVAILGFLGAMLYLLLFSARAGMSVWVFPLFFGIYFALGTVIARMRAELGFIVHDLHNIEPQGVLIDVLGTRRLGPRNLTMFAIFNFFNRAYRAHPAPAQLEAFKFAERANVRARHFVYVILIATLAGTVVTFTMLTHHYYRNGADTGYYGPWALGFGRGLYRQLERWLSFPTESNGLAIGFTGVGFVLGGAMMLIRTRFLWWPLHPLGYAMANSWGMGNLWCPLFVAWALKFTVLKHGGLRAYRRAVPFFLGMALGDYIFGYSWSMGSVLLDRTLYQFWP